MARIPTLQGLIRRRLLVNFRVDPDVMRRHLPPLFRPKLLGDSAVAGICLIRLEQIRPRWLPGRFGFASENAAHRVAVCWSDASGAAAEGVYVPRRDSDSIVNQLAGGRIFPGEHHAARFEVHDDGERIELRMRSKDGRAEVEIRAHLAETLPATSRFGSLEEASTFFERGSLGYSTTAEADRLDGLYLCTRSWKVEPLDVEIAHSSFFADERAFPKGSIEFDCALLMRNIPQEWHSAPYLRVGPASATSD